MPLKVIQCFTNAHGSSYVGGVSTIINAYFENLTKFKDNDIDLELFDYQRSCIIKSSKIANLLYIPQQRSAFKKLIKGNRADIINIHTSREFLFLKDVHLAALAKKRGLSTVLTVHVGDIHTVFNRISFFKKQCIRLINRYVDKLICLSQHIKAQFIENGVHADKCLVVDNFHNMAPPDTSSTIERTSKLHVLFVGAIHKEKGITELLSAVSSLDLDILLDVCGKVTDDSLKNFIKETQERSSDKIIFHGYVAGSKKRMLFERADILVLPSYHEGFPLVILEALATGCAIISTSVGATNEILKSEENVLWVPIKNTEEIAQSLIRFYNNEVFLTDIKERNKQLGQKYTLDNHINVLCTIYKDICRTNSGD